MDKHESTNFFKVKSKIFIAIVKKRYFFNIHLTGGSLTQEHRKIFDDKKKVFNLLIRIHFVSNTNILLVFKGQLVR